MTATALHPDVTVLEDNDFDVACESYLATGEAAEWIHKFTSTCGCPPSTKFICSEHKERWEFNKALHEGTWRCPFCRRRVSTPVDIWEPIR